jgi:ribosomal protein S2
MRISSISPAASSTDKYLPGDINKMKQIENRIERFQQLIKEENQSKDDNNKNSTAQLQNSNYFIGSIIDIQV